MDEKPPRLNDFMAVSYAMDALSGNLTETQERFKQSLGSLQEWLQGQVSGVGHRIDLLQETLQKQLSDGVSILAMSEDISEVVKALPIAQAAMGEVTKDGANPHLRKRYATLASLLGAVMPALNSAGFSMLQPVRYTGSLVMVQTMLMHSSGQWMRNTLAFGLERQDVQGLGSAITYLRRYSLMSLVGVAPVGEDDDGEAVSGPPVQGKAQPPPAKGKGGQRGSSETDGPKGEPPPATKDIDRSGEPAPMPDGDSKDDWEAARKVLHAKLTKFAMTEEQLDRTLAVNEEFMKRCSAILDDTMSKVGQWASARRDQLRAKTTKS